MGIFVSEEVVRNILLNSGEHQIKTITVENFMTIKERTTLEFDENGILNLVGYNDSGKTAMLTAQEVLATGSRANRQVKMIHTKQPFFYVENTFTDGVKTSLKKYASGESVWEMWKEDTLVYANRASDEEGSSLISTGGIPDIMRRYYNIAVDEGTKEIVNFRKNRDKLFLVHTSAGDNGKFINSFLQLQNVTKALDKLNKRKNVLTASLGTKTTQIKTLASEVERLDVMTEEDEKMLREVTENYQNLITQGLVIHSVLTTRKNLEFVPQSEEIEMLETTQFNELLTVQKLADKIRIELPPQVEEVTVGHYQTLISILALRNRLDVTIPKEVEYVETDQYNTVLSLQALRESLNTSITPQVEIVDTSQLEMHSTLTGLRNKLDISIAPEVDMVATEQALTRFTEYSGLMGKLTQWSNNYQEVVAINTEIEEVQEILQHLSATYNYKICTSCGTILL